MANWLNKVRRWIDDEKDLSVIEQALQDSKNAGQNKSKSELFLQELLKGIEKVLHDEITRIPSTQKAYLPQKFAVFISSDDEKRLPKEKREFFEQSLSALIMERAREMVGQLQLTAKSIQVEIRVNAILAENEVDVKAFSEKFDETFEKSLRQSVEWKITPKNQGTIDAFGTEDDEDINFEPLYYLEILQNGRRENEYPIIKREISIGRDYDESTAHIRLPTDNRKISGSHASVRYKDNGEILVTSFHKNPTVVEGKIITKGETANLTKNGTIQIYDFILRLKFKDSV